MTFKDLDQIPGLSRLAKQEFDFPGSAATLDTAEHMTNKYHQEKKQKTQKITLKKHHRTCQGPRRIQDIEMTKKIQHNSFTL